MFEININSDGFFAEGEDGTIVKINDFPHVNNGRELFAYKFDGIDSLVPDEEKLAKIQKEIAEENENTPVVVSDSERLDAIEDAIAELAAIVAGGE